MKIAFIQLGSWGDNVNSTMMLKPIKNKYPGCTIHVHTTDLYASAFINNPHVDQIHTTSAANKAACFDLYNVIPKAVESSGLYDKVFIPAPILHQDRTSRRHPEFGHNIICTFMRVLEDNDIDYDFPVETVLNLTNDEKQDMHKWVDHRLQSTPNGPLYLMEVHGESGQTFWDKNWTVATVRHLMKNQEARLFISRRELTTEISLLARQFHNRVFWAGPLTIRQCSELYNRCTAFFSVSSGLSNACNTSHCRKDIKWIETVNSPSVTSAPLRTENKMFWYDNDVDRYIKMLASNGL